MVVSDTNTLRYLILIDSVHVLPVMYGEIALPVWVYDKELQDPATPAKVREWMTSPPDWIRRHAVTEVDATLNPRQL